MEAGEAPASVVAVAEGAEQPGAPARPETATGDVEASAEAGSVAALLADPGAELPAERALLRRAGTARFSAQGAPVAAADTRFPVTDQAALPVVAQASERVRVVSRTGGARLLLWLDRGDLGRAAVREVALEGSAPPRGVTLYSGAAVEVVERAGDRVRVRREDYWLAFDGWVPAGAIGPIFVRGEASPAAGGKKVVVDCGTELAAAIGGPAMAIVGPGPGGCEAGVEVDALGEPRGGFQEIVVGNEWYTARGFVAAAAAQGDEAGYGLGWGELRAYEERWVALPPGTCLHAERYGEPVGVVTEPLRFAPGTAPAERSWVAGKVSTQWGDIPVWAFVESAAEERWRGCE